MHFFLNKNGYNLLQNSLAVIGSKSGLPQGKGLVSCKRHSFTWTIHNQDYWYMHALSGHLVLRFSSPTTAYMRQPTRSALICVMARHMFGTMPLPGSMLTYCHLDPHEQILVTFESKYKTSHSYKCIWNVVCAMAVILSRERWSKAWWLMCVYGTLHWISIVSDKGFSPV